MEPTSSGIPWQKLAPGGRVELAHEIEFTEARNPHNAVVVTVENAVEGVQARVSHVIPRWDESWFTA